MRKQKGERETKVKIKKRKRKSEGEKNTKNENSHFIVFDHYCLIHVPNDVSDSNVIIVNI